MLGCMYLWLVASLTGGSLGTPASGEGLRSLRIAKLPITLAQVADRFFRELGQGNWERARNDALSYEELARYAKRPPKKEDYQRRLEDFLKLVAFELTNGAKLGKWSVADVFLYPEDSLAQPVIMGVVHATFLYPQQPAGKPQVFTFLQFDQGWKFFLR